MVADAKVVYSKLGMGMGLSFSAIDAENRRILETWTGELSGATPVECSDAPRAEIVPLRQVAKH